MAADGCNWPSCGQDVGTAPAHGGTNTPYEYGGSPQVSRWSRRPHLGVDGPGAVPPVDRASAGPDVPLDRATRGLVPDRLMGCEVLESVTDRERRVKSHGPLCPPARRRKVRSWVGRKPSVHPFILLKQESLTVSIGLDKAICAESRAD